MSNKMSNDILFNIIFGNSGSGGGGGGDNPFVPPTGYKQVGVVEGYPVPRINLRSACVNDLGFPFALGIDDDTVQAGDKILVVGQSTDDGTPFAVWGTVDSTRTAGNYYIARLTVEGSSIRSDSAYVVDITSNGGTLVFGTTKVNVNVPNPSSGSLEITENGTYDVTAKASAVVNVENSYTASDEGKVVDNGALVSQTSQNIGSNGTYDTTTKNEVVVNVPSSGGGEGDVFLPDPTVYTYHKPGTTAPEFYRENFMDASNAVVMFPEGSSDLPAVGDKICVIDVVMPDSSSIPNEPFAVWGTVTSVNSTMFGIMVGINPDGSTVRVNGTHEKTVSSDSNVFGYTKVKVSGGSTPTGTKYITSNGNYDVKNYASANVNVPRTFTTSDNGKVVVNRALVNQTTQTVTANGTVDTTSVKTVTVNVPNSYTASDEGKVVSSGALVGQTTQNITANGTYDTTTKNEVVVNVSGGGGVDEKWRALHNLNTADGSIDITDNDLPSGFIPGLYSFYYNDKLRSFSSQIITTIASYAFQHAAKLQTADFPNVTNVASYAFRSCIALQTVNFPNVTNVATYSFNSCTALQSAKFGSLSTIGSQAFSSCTNLASISGPFTSISDQAFKGCTRLMSVHITQSDSVCTLGNNAFVSTPFITDETGYIYVPDALVESYKSAADWSAVASRIKGESEMPTT